MAQARQSVSSPKGMNTRVESRALFCQSSEILSTLPKSLPILVPKTIGGGGIDWIEEDPIRTMALHHAIAKYIVMITNARMAFENTQRIREQHGKHMMLDTMLALRYRGSEASFPRRG